MRSHWVSQRFFGAERKCTLTKETMQNFINPCDILASWADRQCKLTIGDNVNMHDFQHQRKINDIHCLFLVYIPLLAITEITKLQFHSNFAPRGALVNLLIGMLVSFWACYLWKRIFLGFCKFTPFLGLKKLPSFFGLIVNVLHLFVLSNFNHFNLFHKKDSQGA